MKTEVAGSSDRKFLPEVILRAAQEVANPKNIIDTAIEGSKSDPGAMFEEPVLDALRAVRAGDPAAFSRYRGRIKAASTGVKLAELDKLTQISGQAEANTMNTLITIAKERCTLNHDSDQRAVAVTAVGDHREVWMVQEAGFAGWLRSEFFNQQEAGVAETTLGAAIATIQAIGSNRGSEVEVHTRFAKHGDAYVVDLCDESWRAIKIDPAGYELVDQSPVLFTRNSRMRPLPPPAAAGDLDVLWKYANVAVEQRPLVLAFLLEAMRPDTPYPVLEIVGEQGSAKSTTHRFLRALIDPNKVPLRGSPGSVEDIYVAAASNWVVSYENLSGLPAEMQDALCTLSTGGGFATRKFYTNGEEHVLETKRPVMLNGISGIATRPDLIERTVRIDAPKIPSGERREDTDLESAWEEDYPKIFGALLDLFAKVLKALPDIQLREKQRMANFESLGEALMIVQGHPPGSFSAMYVKAQKEGAERALEAYGIASALAAFAERKTTGTTHSWSGTIGELLRELSYCLADRSNWPRSARGLSDQLRRLAPGLRGQGLVVEIGEKKQDGRQVTVSWPKVAPLPSAPVSQTPPSVPVVASGVAPTQGTTKPAAKKKTPKTAISAK